MKPDWSDEAARILPSTLHHHLVSTGWQEVTTSDAANYWRYHLELAKGLVSVDVPKCMEFIDYARRLVEVIEILSLVEERSARSIVFDLSARATQCART